MSMVANILDCIERDVLDSKKLVESRVSIQATLEDTIDYLTKDNLILMVLSSDGRFIREVDVHFFLIVGSIEGKRV